MKDICKRGGLERQIQTSKKEAAQFFPVFFFFPGCLWRVRAGGAGPHLQPGGGSGAPQLGLAAGSASPLAAPVLGAEC